MPDAQHEKIQPFEIKRACQSSMDTEQLVLKDVDKTESVFIRSLAKLKDSGIPQLPTIRKGPEQDSGVDIVPWDLYFMMKYRQDWLPTGYGLGDLVYTTSLLPSEETTLEIKTWETDKRLQETEQDVEERNTSDLKTSNSNSSELTDKTETKEHTYVDAKAGYSGFGFSASVSAGWSSDIGTMNQQVAKQSAQRTQQASHEQRARQKVKMTLSREKGSESKNIRKLKNINQAHTLNANFYEVLKEYQISLYLYDVAIVMLGDDIKINQPITYEDITIYPHLNDSSSAVKWGELLQLIKNVEWVKQFTIKYGVSPIQILREGWMLPLSEGALVARDWWKYPLKSKERIKFQDDMLQFIRPTEAWVEPDEKGTLRWAYEVISGKEKAFLNFLYPYIIYEPLQVVYYMESKGASYKNALETVLGSVPISAFNVTNNTKIRIPGPFENANKREFNEVKMPQWIQKILQMMQDARDKVGLVTAAGQQAAETVLLPTQSIYSDVSLGICSGAEDYIEVNRQFDLEIKKLEVEKLKLELEKMKLINTHLSNNPAHSVIIKNPTEDTKVNLNLDIKTEAETAGTEISVESGGA